MEAPVPNAPPAVQEEVRRRILARFQRFPPVTSALVLCVLVLHLVVGLDDWMTGRSYLDGRIAGLYDAFLGARTQGGLVIWGANDAAKVGEGAWWRLLSSVFLHADALHLVLNGLALFGLGRLCEAVFGPVRLLWLFLLAGIVGALASHLGRVPGLEPGAISISVGASGGVFGLMGAGVVFGQRFRRSLPPAVRQIFWRGLVPWILLNIFIGLSVPRIDNLGHFGGLFYGAMLALVLASPVIPGSEGKPRITVLLGFLSACLLGWASSAALLNRLFG